MDCTRLTFLRQISSIHRSILNCFHILVIVKLDESIEMSHMVHRIGARLLSVQNTVEKSESLSVVKAALRGAEEISNVKSIQAGYR